MKEIIKNGYCNASYQWANNDKSSLSFCKGCNLTVDAQ
jgi:hypothetical protein